MGFLNKFISFGDDDKQSTPVTPVATQAPVAQVPTPVISSDAVSQDMYNEIMAELQKIKSSGYGYMEFKAALKNMDALPLPEDQKYKAVWAIISAQGVTSKGIVESINKYIESLKGINQAFTNDIAEMTNTEVLRRRKDAESVTQQIQSASDLIKETTQHITVLQEKKATLEREAQDQELKIARIQSGYASTVKSITDSMTNDVNKITTYIGA